MVSPIVIGGPTGSGKSDYAIALAQQICGEIICADSRQVYMGMRIGSASPTDEELAQVPHHHYNFVDPNNVYDAARFIADTDRVIGEIASRGKTPILVGGTGLYLRCWRYGLNDVPQSDPQVREALKRETNEKGVPALYTELQALDPESADSIAPQDGYRILRALEIFRMTGHKASRLRKSHFDTPRQEAQWILIERPRDELNERLLVRTKKMFEGGLVEEALALRERTSPGCPLLTTIGYKESLAFADGLTDLPQAIELTFIRTRQYAKRQMTWFSKEGWWQRDLPAIRSAAID
jgi:tRNA dimethylallyltransferase